MSADILKDPPRKDLLDIESLTKSEVEFIIDAAKPFKELFTRSVKKVPTLRGKTVLNLFFEPSTRTRTSFEIAAKRLSADVANFTVSASSVSKGETVLDTVDTLQAMKVDYIVVRHGSSGIPSMIANHTQASVLNAGDGWHAHPTQALLDAYTMHEVYGDLSGKKIVLVGDIRHSRVARSVTQVARKLGMEVGWFGPGTLMPANRPDGIHVFNRFSDALDWDPDIVYLLRLQLERQAANFFPTLREYHNYFGITNERFKRIENKGVYVMHPGPVNRGVELTDLVMDYERCLVNTQVEIGIATRMAVLYWLQPGAEDLHIEKDA